MKALFALLSVGVLIVAIWGWAPLSNAINPDDALAPGYDGLETGVERLADGTYHVSALTRMPGVNAKMVKWWFTDFLQTSEHYSWWHPTAHVWMDWENKVPGKIVGASHLVHEYIGGEMQKLRIQFVPPEQVLGPLPELEEGTFVLCAWAGLLEEPLYVAKMCHVVRDTAWGAEMRSNFWMGHVARREGNEAVTSIEGIVGNTALARYILLDEAAAIALMTHAIEEMGYLSDLLPALYARETSARAE
ncbi:hypothetical protein QMT40_001138 [Parvibaculaceae bacterium PLY_AMNH_Bact1]|nr:hypothetical protein QMT40_001138 [Parvibaculaceae bacterium PLY_AMNH_Bact1]